MLSLAKLTALASGSSNDQLEPVLSRIEHAMSVVVAQQQVPKQVLEQNGLDPKTMRVMSPRELIEVHIVFENWTSKKQTLGCPVFRHFFPQPQKWLH